MKPIIRLARCPTEHFCGKRGESCKREVVLSKLKSKGCHSFFLSDERNEKRNEGGVQFGYVSGRFPNLEIIKIDKAWGDPSRENQLILGFVALDHKKNIAAIKPGCTNRNYLECVAWTAQSYVLESCLLDEESAFEVASAYLENLDFGENFDSVNGSDSWLCYSEYERKLANKL